MNSVLAFFGRFLSNFYTQYNNLGAAIIVAVILFRLVISPMMQNHFKSIKLTEALKPRIDAIQKKYADSEETANKESMELMNNVMYPYFGTVTTFILEFILAFFIALTVTRYKIYIAPNISKEIAFSTGFLFVNDLSLSAFSLFKEKLFNINYLIFPALATALKYFIDRYMREHTLVEREQLEYFLLAVVLITSMAVSQAFAVTWIVLEIGNIIHILYVKKFTNVKLVDREISSNKHVKKIDKAVVGKQKKSK